MFEPVIPQINTSTTRKLIVTVPGAHETMVGNQQWDAHGSTGLQTPNNNKNPNFAYVGQVSRVIAEQLLTSPEWGNVPLAKDTTIGSGGVDTAEEFESLVMTMWNQDYASTRDYAFFPLWGVYDLRFPARLLGRDYMLRDLFLLFNPQMPARLCFVAPNRHNSGSFVIVPPRIESRRARHGIELGLPSEINSSGRFSLARASHRIVSPARVQHSDFSPPMPFAAVPHFSGRGRDSPTPGGPPP